jgi:hypothetical protein
LIDPGAGNEEVGGMTHLLAYSTSAYDWNGMPVGHTGSAGIAPTLYSIGIVICCALLVLWWGVVRPRR